MQTVDDKTVISGLRWYASDQYGLLITVGGVGGDFSQTGDMTQTYTVECMYLILFARLCSLSISVIPVCTFTWTSGSF